MSFFASSLFICFKRCKTRNNLTIKWGKTQALKQNKKRLPIQNFRSSQCLTPPIFFKFKTMSSATLSYSGCLVSLHRGIYNAFGIHLVIFSIVFKVNVFMFFFNLLILCFKVPPFASSASRQLFQTSENQRVTLFIVIVTIFRGFFFSYTLIKFSSL